MTVDSAAGPSRLILVVGAVLLVLATIWALPGTTASTAAPGVRSDPGDVYNPVVAGEALPDGFRQLLPRDAILPVYDPQFVTPSESNWSPETDVIGIEVNPAEAAILGPLCRRFEAECCGEAPMLEGHLYIGFTKFGRAIHCYDRGRIMYSNCRIA